jgi:acetyl-CoA carboxylase carboxyltransferase component
MSKIDELFERKEKIQQGGGSTEVEKQHEKGKMSARERINYLLDEGSFVEMDAFVNHRCSNFNMEDINTPAEGVVTGYGTINGRLVFVYAQDFTVIKGALGEMHAKKICKVLDMAVKMGAPVIGINDSEGARIQEGVDALSGYGQIFYRNSRASGVVPQISVILGTCAGGAVFSPALADFTFMASDTSKMFISSPKAISTATGEDISEEDLGGAAICGSKSGVADFVLKDDTECLDGVKKLIGYLPSNNTEIPLGFESKDDLNRNIPELDEVIAELSDDASDKAVDMKYVIQTIVDDGDFFEVKQGFAQNIIVGYGRINGRTIGIVANQPMALSGFLDMDAADKAARFIRTCDAFNIPILNLVDVPGFLPDVNQEMGGIINNGAKMIYAYSEATVPKVTMIVRKAYGSAYVAMCSKELGADVVYAWPNAEIAVTSPDGIANIIFKNEIESAINPEEELNAKTKEYKDEFTTPYIAAERGYIDDVIVPSESRQRIAAAFEMLQNKRDKGLPKKHGNLPL